MNARDKAPLVPEEIREGYERYESRVTHNIENFVGLAKVPIGLAGPLTIHGEHARGTFYVPMATTEGTQVASASRGMKVFEAAGGVHACLLADRGIQRAPVFEFDAPAAARDFAQAIVRDTEWLAQCLEQTTRVGRFLSVRPLCLGRRVHLRVTMTSGDAAGQNMVSVAVAAACRAIEGRYPSIRHSFMDAGLSGEKMPSHVNVLEGRGKQVCCSVAIPEGALYELTRATATDIVRWYQIFSNAAAAIGWKGTATPSIFNSLAALYIALGQDVGSVPESGIGHAHIEHDTAQGLLHWEMTFSGLVIGTYGGGTHLPSQRAALEMLGCYGTGGVPKLAELVAATAMAAEISLITAVCSGEWIDAHDRMGRNRH